MKLYRFMSKEEFKKYIDGEKLINKTNHHKENNRKTNSVGFCFFNYAHYKPEAIFHSVTGVVRTDICCIFETERENVRKTWGRYARTIDEEKMLRESFIAKEYCTTEYSKDTFKLIKCTIPNWFEREEWDWQNLNI